MRIFSLILFLSISHVIVQAQPYRNLALEGGGIRGIAYAGAIAELEKQGTMDSIQNVSGTSVGAIVGSLICVGYSAEELKEILSELNIQKFNDGKWFFLGGQSRLRKEYGWYRGDALENWIEDLIVKKTGRKHLTFKQLHELKLQDPHYKDLYATATNLSRQRLAVFSWQNVPDMSIATAVRASMSIPLYFRAVQLDITGRTSKTGDFFVDGGLLMNYPLTLFDSGTINPKTIGLKLERPEQIDYAGNATGLAPYQITDLKSYIGAFYNLTLESLNRQESDSAERRRTIYISTAGIQPRVRAISKEQKAILFESGRQATREFFRVD